VVPAVLRKLNILQVVDKDLEQLIAKRQNLDSGDDREIELRLCAVYACELIVRRARSKGFHFNEMDLDYYLWLKGKEPGFRNFERHYTKNTYFY
jgi:hypothetical protein